MRLARLILALPSIVAVGLGAQDVHVHVNPAVTTGIDGPTDFPTIQNALDHHPFAPAGYRVVIEIAPGTYHERLNVTQNLPNITLLGMGAKPEDTVITSSLNAKQAGGTFFTETVEINGDAFEADNLTIENTAGNTGQAVAAAVRADRAVFKHVRFLGHQDTLFADFGRQYYLDCFITGDVDFVFGNAAAVFDRTEFLATAPGYVTAQSRTSAAQPTGFILIDSRISSSFDVTGNPSAPATARRTVFLGRPWRPYARVILIDTTLDAQVDPAGWNNWGKAANESTAYYAEVNSSRPRCQPRHPRPLGPHPVANPGSAIYAKKLPRRPGPLEP